MTSKSLYASVLVLGGLTLFATTAIAQDQRPPKPDFAAMASTLNVPQDALMGCLGDRPKQGERPARPDAAKIAKCLGAAGHKVDVKSVDKALAAAGPKRK